MKRNNHKTQRHTVMPAEKKEASSKPVNLLPHLADTQNPERSSLETLHRLSWRRYILSMMAPFLIQGFCAGAAFADTKPLTSVSAQESALGVGKAEGEKESPKKKSEVAKKVVKTKKVELPGVDEADQKAEGVTKSVKGTVSAKNNYGLAVEYGVDPDRGTLEMWANLNNKTKVSGVKSISMIEAGDQVELRYKELVQGGKKILLDVSLIQKKPKEESEISPAISLIPADIVKREVSQ